MYNLNNLNSSEFESLVQALAVKIIGNGITPFGKGTDGGREATFKGKAPYPSPDEKWSGYWVIQAKFKNVVTSSDEKDFNWVRDQLKGELDKYSTRRIMVEHPNNFLLFTNVILTAKPATGGRDKANALEREYEKKYKIKNIRIISWDDLQGFLDNNRDVAISYAPFTLPGDILSKLLRLLEFKEDRVIRVKEEIGRFIEAEFIEDSQSKLDHAGKLTSDRVNLEKVFIDLYATADGQVSNEVKSSKFIDFIIRVGNSINREKGSPNRFVLVAGPGYGKSTLTQFVAQIYRAYFLKVSDNQEIKIEGIDNFIGDYKSIVKIEPKWQRLPIKITLKVYAGWIKENQRVSLNANVSLIEYVRWLINRKSGSGSITAEEIENLIQTLPSTFIFDGLDEVPASSNRDIVLEALNFFVETILRRLGADTIVISTTRPQGYSKEFDTSKYRHLYITDLTLQDCQLYLNRLMLSLIDDSSEREGKLAILREAQEHPEISRLMRSPLQASIMAILVKSGGEPPRNKFDLFTEYYETIFKREKQRNISRILVEQPDYVREIHNSLGLYLQIVSELSTNPSASIKISEFNKLIKSYLQGLGLEIEEVDRIAIEINIVSTDRLVFISELEDGKIGFAVRSLQEYFAANGHIHNTDDETIRKKVSLISTNSYWGNTLLFSFGFIAKNKNYLADFIESLCNELNGSGNEKNVKTLTDVGKMGSWLALDVLNEGVFRSFPNIENKFANLISPLFTLGNQKKHTEICKLPLKIIERWIIKYLDDNLSESNLTCWHLLTQLDKQAVDVKSLIQKHLPPPSLARLIIVKNLIQNGFNNDYIVRSFVECLRTDLKREITEIVVAERNYKFLRQVCIHQSQTQNSINVLVEVLFLIACIYNYYDFIRLYDLLDLLGLNLKRGNKLEPIILFDTHEIEIVEGYSCRVLKTKISLNSNVKKIATFSDKNSITLVSTLIEFLLSPSYLSYNRFEIEVNKQAPGYKEWILFMIQNVNSFFKLIVSTPSELAVSEGDFISRLNEIDLVTPSNLQVDKNKILLNKRNYSLGTTFTSSRLLLKLEQFRRDYLLNPQNLYCFIEYVKFFEKWILGRMVQQDIEELRNDILHKKYYQKGMMEILNEDRKLNYLELYHAFFFLESKDLIALEIADSKASNFRVKLYTSETLENWINRLLLDNIYSKIVALILFQLSDDKAPSYRMLLQHMLVCFALSKELDMKEVPFELLIKKKFNSDDEICKSVILLMDKNFSESHLTSIKEIWESDSLINDIEFQKVIVYMLKYAHNSEVMDKCLIYIESRLTWQDNELLGEFQNLIRLYVGSKPTGMEKQKWLSEPT